MSVRDKLRILAEGARGAAHEVSGAINEVNKWQKKTGFADPKRMEHLGENWGGFGGFGAFGGNKSTNINPRRTLKTPRARREPFEVDGQTIHIHINIPSKKRRRY